MDYTRCHTHTANGKDRSKSYVLCAAEASEFATVLSFPVSLTRHIAGYLNTSLQMPQKAVDDNAPIISRPLLTLEHTYVYVADKRPHDTTDSSWLFPGTSGV